MHDIYLDEEPEPSSNIFAYVPYDILSKVLNTFLTASDRFNFNQVLEPQERLYKKFGKTEALQHELHILNELLHSRVLRHDMMQFNSARLHTTINIFRQVGESKYNILFKHWHNFRNVVEEKLKEHATNNTPTMAAITTITRHMKDKLMLTCQTSLEQISSIPYGEPLYPKCISAC